MQSSSRYIVKFATAMIALTTTISTGQAQEYYPREAG